MICNYNSPESIQWPHTPGECFSPSFVPGNSKPINFTEARSRTRLPGPGRVGLSLLDHLPPQCVPWHCDEGHWDKGTGQWPPGPGRRVPDPLGCPARGMPKSQEGGDEQRAGACAAPLLHPCVPPCPRQPCHCSRCPEDARGIPGEAAPGSVPSPAPPGRGVPCPSPWDTRTRPQTQLGRAQDTRPWGHPVNV